LQKGRGNPKEATHDAIASTIRKKREKEDRDSAGRERKASSRKKRVRRASIRSRGQGDDSPPPKEFAQSAGRLKRKGVLFILGQKQGGRFNMGGGEGLAAAIEKKGRWIS